MSSWKYLRAQIETWCQQIFLFKSDSFKQIFSCFAILFLNCLLIEPKSPELNLKLKKFLDIFSSHIKFELNFLLKFWIYFSLLKRSSLIFCVCGIWINGSKLDNQQKQKEDLNTSRANHKRVWFLFKFLIKLHCEKHYTTKKSIIGWYLIMSKQHYFSHISVLCTKIISM